MEKITLVLLPGRVEVHDGLLPGAKTSGYYHPDMIIGIQGTMKDTHVTREAISHCVMCALQDRHMPVSSLRYNASPRKPREQETPKGQLKLW